MHFHYNYASFGLRKLPSFGYFLASHHLVLILLPSLPFSSVIPAPLHHFDSSRNFSVVLLILLQTRRTKWSSYPLVLTSACFWAELLWFETKSAHRACRQHPPWSLRTCVGTDLLQNVFFQSFFQAARGLMGVISSSWL